MEAEIDDGSEEFDKIVTAYVFDEIVDEFALVSFLYQRQHARFVLILNYVFDLLFFLIILVTIVLLCILLVAAIALLCEVEYALVVFLEDGL